MDWDDYDPFDEPLDQSQRAFKERFFSNRKKPAPRTPVPTQPTWTRPAGIRKKWIAALLFLFFGPTGAGNLYMRQNTRALVKVVLFFLMISAGLTLVGILLSIIVLPPLLVWSFLEFIFVLNGSMGYDRDGQGLPLG